MVTKQLYEQLYGLILWLFHIVYITKKNMLCPKIRVLQEIWVFIIIFPPFSTIHGLDFSSFSTQEEPEQRPGR